MAALLQYLPFLGLIVLANVAEDNRTARVATYLAFLVINIALLLGGLLFYLASSLMRQSDFVESLPSVAALQYIRNVDFGQIGVIFCAISLSSSIFLLPRVRKSLARWIPINPQSPLHCAAIVFAVYYVGFTAAQVALVGGLEGLTKISLNPSAFELLQAGSFMVAFALLGVGWGTRRRWREVLSRLKLELVTGRQWLWALGLTFCLLVFDYAVSAIWAALDPDSYDLISKTAAGLYGDLATPQRALLLALSAGIGEEVLFRGALQPRFGIWLTSLAFTLGHQQYGFSPALVEVFVISMVLGLVRRKMNTTTCIAIHTAYNFVDLLLVTFTG